MISEGSWLSSIFLLLFGFFFFFFLNDRPPPESPPFPPPPPFPISPPPRQSGGPLARLPHLLLARKDPRHTPRRARLRVERGPRRHLFERLLRRLVLALAAP